MERVLSLLDLVFQDGGSMETFWRNAGFLFAEDVSVTDADTDMLFQTLGRMLEKEDVDSGPVPAGRMFIFLSGLAYATKRMKSAHLWLDRAFMYADDEGLKQKIKGVQADTFGAFMSYKDQAEAFEDYLSLFTGMVQGMSDDNDDGLVTQRHLGDAYDPILEMGFFEDFEDTGLTSPREFWDFLNVIRIREAVTGINGPALPYLDIAERFDLTTLHVMIMLFLYFSTTSGAFAKMLEDRLQDFSGVFPSVGLLDRLVQRTFGVNRVANDVLSSQGTLCKWGLVHLQSPEGMDLISTFQHLASLDNAVVLFILSNRVVGSGFLQKEVVKTIAGLPTALANASELVSLLHGGQGRVFIHNAGGISVAGELAMHISDSFAGVGVFSLDRVLSTGRNLRLEAVKSAFLTCEIQGLYPLFELAGDYKDRDRRDVKLCLQDLDEVASQIDRGFAIFSAEDLFDLVYPNVRDLGGFSLRAPVGKQQEAAWEYWLSRFGIDLTDQDKRNVLRTFPRVRLNVRRVLSKLRNRTVSFDVIKKTVYQGMDADFGFGAQRITPVFDWDSIVLPKETLVRINEILTFYRYKDRVMTDWGFAKGLPYGKAISALFYGPPGTGKSMMAQVIAKDLNMDLFRVDLSSVISKYIGETEKALRRVFEAAQDSPTILMFDEADSLFTKRTEVKSSTDRYANVEVNYLLQKMEEFEGITVLTTNNYGNIDDAFKRRIRFKIKFPMPDIDTRVRLWKSMLPQQALVAKGIDFRALARDYEFSPAHIKNAVLRAAFMAAERGDPIAMSDLAVAAMSEAKELGQVVRDV